MSTEIKIYRTLFLFFMCNLLVAQTSDKSYRIRYQTFVNGDMKIIGNNIVNRNVAFSSPNKPFDELGNSVKHNDQFSMEYIDIDDDSSTFSSSSAYLDFSGNQVSRVVYAGLYWAATYPYNKGTSKDMNTFKVQDERRESFSGVLLKLPGKSSYERVQGTLVYDGKNDEKFQDNMPYVMYADVTKWLQPLANPTGEYTVANIRATQGQVLGGVSGGWTMIVVYEQKDSPTKKIITYDGFEDIFRNTVRVEFSGFRTPEQGIIKAELAGSVLEGDHSIPGSRLAINTPGNKETYLSTATRPERNFFNSGITYGDSFVNNRIPASKNTLGYDIFTMELPNADNSVIGNNVSQMVLTMPASADRYYSFFTALSISSEIVKTEEEPSKEVQQVLQSVTEKEPEKPKEEPKKDNLDKNVDAVLEPAPNSDLIISVPNLTQSDVPKGFYNVVAVFITGISAERQKALLYKKGIKSDYIYDPISNKRYVYTDRSDTYEEALKKQEEIRKNELFTDAWILAVNQDK